MNSQYHIDTPKYADYPLPAVHCQSILTDRYNTQDIKSSLFGGELVRPPS